MIILGDCRERMAAMEAASVDAVICDPPYGLKFMGREWDHGVPGVPFWAEALRVAKPGAHALIFGGDRTHHRLMVAIEDAGWEIRTCLYWLFGAGFPKSLNVSKAIDKAAGAAREKRLVPTKRGNLPEQAGPIALGASGMHDTSRPVTDAARKWEGWGTALKPAAEIIILARKPLGSTVAACVLAHGTGAINVDGCRIGTTVETWPKSRTWGRPPVPTDGSTGSTGSIPLGRWPANVLLDEEAARMLDEQSGITTSNPNPNPNPNYKNEVFGRGMGGVVSAANQHADSGGASRFFLVVDSHDSSTYNEPCEKTLGATSESQMVAGIESGERTEAGSSISSLNTDGSGNEHADLSRPGTKSTTGTETTLTTGSPISGSLRPRGTTTTISDSARIIEPSEALRGDGVSDAASTDPSTNSSDAPAEPIRATASPVPAKLLRSGERTTESTTTPTCAPIDRPDADLVRFHYTAKASRADREDGLEGMRERPASDRHAMSGLPDARMDHVQARRGAANHHPTVKPTDLMRWLCRLVTPPGGLILDPFAGSGSTGVAAVAEGFRFVGIEQDAEYVAIAERRIANVAPLFASGAE